MKEIVALVGSPRRLGNSELMAKEISRQISEPHTLRLVRLPALDIRPCRACYTCLFDEKGCPQQDDFGKILAALVQADGFILSAPTYLLSANASLKMFLDRGLALYSKIEKLWGKPAVAVTVAGIPGMEGFAKLCLESAARAMGADIKESEVVYGALPGEVLMSEDNRQTARRLARALFGPRPDWQSLPWRCGACGGDTFRFLGPQQIRCMTCSSPGRIVPDRGTFHLSVRAPGDHFFLSLEGALKHRDWLKGMKKRFQEKKDDLKSICLDYRKDGDWLKSHLEEQAGHE